MINHKCDDIAYSPAKQRGVATLLISVIILLLITITVLYTSKTVFLEQKLTNNDLRSKIAFENAESGIALALNAMDQGKHVEDANNANNFFIFDNSGNDGVADSDTTTLTSGSVQVVLTVPDPDEPSIFSVVSTGFSDDGSAQRTITQWVTTIDPLPNEPDNPMVTRGSVGLGGSATVYNPEGNSTIWSGDDVSLGNNQKTAVPNPSEANYPVCMATPMACCFNGDSNPNVNDCNTKLAETSTKDVMGLDVVEYDSGLANLTAEEFFQNFFGMSKDTYKDSVIDRVVQGANAGNAWDAGTPGIDKAPLQVIWVDGDVENFGGTVGCTVDVNGASGVCPADNVEPSIIIIDGDLDTGGNPHFYGLVYVTGQIDLTGTTTVWGSIVVENAVPNSGSGNLQVVYRSDVLSRISDAGNPAGASGSWRDF